MQVTRMSHTMVDIDGVIYVRLDFVDTPNEAIRDHVAGMLRRNGEMSQGVILNRCRKWYQKDVRDVMDAMTTSGEIECRATVHKRTLVPVFYYSLTRP